MKTTCATIPPERAAALAVLALLAVWTAVAPAPWIPAGDSGELAAAAWDLGIPHNPGYPLFLLLGKGLATLLPLGTVALRVSLLSGLCTLAAASVVLLLVLPRLLPGDRAATAAGSLFVGVALLSGRYRSLFREGEVYGTALLLLTLLAVATIMPWGQGRRRAPLVGLLAGLAVLAHYQAVVVAALLLPAAAFARHRSDGDSPPLLRPALVAGGLAALPLLLYLPLRSLADPLPDWGNPETWGNFLFHVTGGEHLGTRLGVADAAARAIRLAGEAAAPWGWWILAAGIGVAVAVRRSGAWPLLAGVAVGEAAYALLLNRVEPVITPLMPATGLLAASLAGAGVAAVGRLAGRGRPWVTAAAVLLPALLVLAGPKFRDRDLPSAADGYPQERAGRLTEAVPPGGVAVVSGDATVFPLAYLRAVGGLRPDLLVIDRTGSVFRYPGWDPAKIDADSRRLVEARILTGGAPVIALGIAGPVEFGPLADAGEGPVVALSGRPLDVPIPDPAPLLGLPAGGMTRRTVAEGIFQEVRKWGVDRGRNVGLLTRVSLWGRDDPYLLNEAGIRLFREGDRDAAAAAFASGASRFPDVPALRRNLEALGRPAAN